MENNNRNNHPPRKNIIYHKEIFVLKERDFFNPRKNRRKKKITAPQKPENRVDTLAVLHDGKKYKYLLRKGEKVWIK
jgi:hypothetical protein